MVNKFVNSAKFMKERMKVITITENHPRNKNNIFKGGLSIIESKKSREILPFELSTGIKVPRVPGETIVELSRVAAEKGQGSGEVLKDLVEQSVNLIKADPSITKVYYYTSKAHHKVYSSYGFNGKVIHRPNDKEVVVEIDVRKLMEKPS